MVAEVRPNYESEWAAISAVAQKLGIDSAATLRRGYVGPGLDADARARPRVRTEEAAEIRRLLRAGAELRRATGILKAAAFVRVHASLIVVRRGSLFSLLPGLRLVAFRDVRPCWVPAQGGGVA
jgi:transposase